MPGAEGLFVESLFFALWEEALEMRVVVVGGMAEQELGRAGMLAAACFVMDIPA